MNWLADFYGYFWKKKKKNIAKEGISFLDQLKRNLKKHSFVSFLKSYKINTIQGLISLSLLSSNKFFFFLLIVLGGEF